MIVRLAVVGFLSCLCALASPADPFEFARSSPAVVEARLRRAVSGNARRKEELQKLFEEAGCSAGCLELQKVKASRHPNLVSTLAGTDAGTIVVGAHYDAVEAGDGVVDNWSGASLLPTLYENMKEKPRRHTFVFIGFTDEEKGLVGSESYVRELDKEKLGRIRAMVNLDSLGLSPTKGWLSHADKNLAQMLAALASALKLPLDWVNVDGVGSSDSESFARKKVPAITIHSVTQETLSVLHSPRDRVTAIALDAYYDTYRLLAAYLVYLDLKLD